MIRILLIFLMLLPSMAQAYEDQRTVESVATTDSTKALFTNISTSATVDTVSESLVNVSMTGSLGVMWQASSTGTASFTIQALQSFQRPTAETLQDASYVVWNGSNAVSDSAWHMATLDTVVEPYLRFRVFPTGQGSTATVQIKVEKL